MDELYIEMIGAVASTLTTIAFLPQALKSIREKDTRSVSLKMYIVLNVGIVLWFAYAIMIVSWPMIIGDIVVLPMTLTILWLKLRYG